LVKLAAHPRFEIEESHTPIGAGRNDWYVFGMQVAPPVDVVPQELDRQRFKERVVLTIWAEKARKEGGRINGFHHAPPAARSSVKAVSCAIDRTGEGGSRETVISDMTDGGRPSEPASLWLPRRRAMT
jgi:hypothetical protein